MRSGRREPEQPVTGPHRAAVDQPIALHDADGKSGEVEVQAKPAPVHLGDGDFFGEIALLHRSERTATVRAVTRCRLLVLDAEDFHELVATHDDLREALNLEVEKRIAATPKDPE